MHRAAHHTQSPSSLALGKMMALILAANCDLGLNRHRASSVPGDIPEQACRGGNPRYDTSSGKLRMGLRGRRLIKRVLRAWGLSESKRL